MTTFVVTTSKDTDLTVDQLRELLIATTGDESISVQNHYWPGHPEFVPSYPPMGRQR